MTTKSRRGQTLNYRLQLTAVLVPLVLLLGCGQDDPAGPASDSVVIQGTAIDIYNQIPADGPVTITITTKVGKTEYLVSPTYFAVPPLTQEDLDLLDLILQVEVGDFVRAEGKRTQAGIKLKTLEILAEQP